MGGEWVGGMGYGGGVSGLVVLGEVSRVVVWGMAGIEWGGGIG